ncbi:Bax inhibitor-1/YccA family protein [Dysgonomonas sp. ZJ279]|uniref:Bax inhibitor-1/YccA family protein n=1 Tax=Dysgonomonas sp. ZJ279 TaxID=2709796 RepID=UPI001C87BCF5|nr:Bax inhibitor-1/YccA family protein [Dysgonomonas sp. ZJ279]
MKSTIFSIFAADNLKNNINKMGLFDSSNPSFGKDTYDKVGKAVDSANVMTVNGAVGKTGLLLALVVAGAAITWNMFTSLAYQGLVMPLFWLGLIGGLIVSLIIIFKKEMAPYLSPVYAILEGLALGGISVIANAYYPGIVFQALSLTFVVATVMLILYRFRVIRATQKFKSVIFIATASIAVFYLISFVLSFFGISSPAYAATPLGIGISVFVVIIAALNLIIDFDFIEKGAEAQAPRYMEWYGAFGLMITLVWLYIEILRLLIKIAGRSR